MGGEVTHVPCLNFTGSYVRIWQDSNVACRLKTATKLVAIVSLLLINIIYFFSIFGTFTDHYQLSNVYADV